jgi:hypothetical protein
MFYGVIDQHSLARPYSATEWASAVKEGTTMHARIVLVDHGSKSIRLSVRPHVLEMRAPHNLPALGKRHLLYITYIPCVMTSALVF